MINDETDRLFIRLVSEFMPNGIQSRANTSHLIARAQILKTAELNLALHEHMCLHAAITETESSPLSVAERAAVNRAALQFVPRPICSLAFVAAVASETAASAALHCVRVAYLCGVKLNVN